MDIDSAAKNLYENLKNQRFTWFSVGHNGKELIVSLQKKSKSLLKLNSTIYEGFSVRVKYIGLIKLL